MADANKPFPSQNKRSLLEALKKTASSFSMLDIVKVRTFMLAEVKHLPEKYRKIYSTDLFDYLYQSFLELQGAKLQDPETSINQDEFEDVNACITDLSVDSGPDKAKYISFFRTTALYLIFIANKPIHPPGMKFPGNLEIVSKNGQALWKLSFYREYQPQQAHQF